MNGPLVSIIINNYNYARFLGEAIDSALMQTYPHVEIIVVDDGSTDNSREVIYSYGNRIIPVLKENGGQASALNAGFKVSRGNVICFLDSDDVFLPDKVEEIVKARIRYPHAVLYYHRLQNTCSKGFLISRPWPEDLWDGFIRERVENSGGWWPRPTTSALCFSRQYLERVLPIPEDNFRLCADAYVGDLAPFLGVILGLPKVLTLYRKHGQNYWDSLITKDPKGTHTRVKQYIFEHEQLKRALLHNGFKTNISLDRHLPYLLGMYSLNGRPSFWKMASLIMNYPTLSYRARFFQMAKFLLNKYEAVN